MISLICPPAWFGRGTLSVGACAWRWKDTNQSKLCYSTRGLISCRESSKFPFSNHQKPHRQEWTFNREELIARFWLVRKLDWHFAKSVNIGILFKSSHAYRQWLLRWTVLCNDKQCINSFLEISENPRPFHLIQQSWYIHVLWQKRSDPYLTTEVVCMYMK